jgi:hypothetical protein
LPTCYTPWSVLQDGIKNVNLNQGKPWLNNFKFERKKCDNQTIMKKEMKIIFLEFILILSPFYSISRIFIQFKKYCVNIFAIKVKKDYKWITSLILFLFIIVILFNLNINNNCSSFIIRKEIHHLSLSAFSLCSHFSVHSGQFHILIFNSLFKVLFQFSITVLVCYWSDSYI